MSMFETTYGALAAMPAILKVPAVLVGLGALGFAGARLWLWTLALAATYWLLGAPLWLWLLTVPVLGVLLIVPVRRALLSAPVLKAMKGFMPAISDTERTAIEAGTTWLDSELFSGKPDLQRLAGSPYPELNAKEQTFLDGPVAKVCAMTDDWEVFQQRDLPAEVWEFLKKERFLGMIIPEEYGGLGFSAAANSAVVARLTSRSMPLAITVMVPNSLGPAELLVHYGTEEQKQRWLPGLARGEEIPAFALTEPGAGSDAGSIQAKGVVFRDDDGEVKLRLNWDKRYITLASIATVLGLAFHLEDPDNLLGKGTHLGITCALIPVNTEGVVADHRHDPLGVPFVNCPTQGRDVVVGLDAIIGGVDGAGQGWRMLMECLAAGRGISLPANSTGGAQLVARSVGAYAAVRVQFGLPIGKFEGIEEPLAQIAGFTYLLEAMRRYTCGGLDSGAKPAVVTAIAKYNSTELWRQVINQGMDVMAGAAISRGPRNVLAHSYMATPICITVEGANILTRTLMIFGQGAIRCHPFAFKEIDAISRGDLTAFDKAFWGHVGHIVRNGFRAGLLSLSRGHLARSPSRGPTRRYWKKLAWASSSFALLADVAMGGLGGDLKRREKVTGRFADVFSWMYLGAATLRRFEAEGSRPEDEPLMRWAMEYALARMQQAFDGLYGNLPLPGLGWLLRGPLALWSRLNPLGSGPSDRVGHQAARCLLQPGEQRDRLTEVMYVPTDEGRGIGRLERALRRCTEVEPLLKRIKAAIKSGKLPKGKPAALLDEAVQAGILDAAEREKVLEAEAARLEAITVDAFSQAEYLATAAAADRESTVGA